MSPTWPYSSDRASASGICDSSSIYVTVCPKAGTAQNARLLKLGLTDSKSVEGRGGRRVEVQISWIDEVIKSEGLAPIITGLIYKYASI